MTAQTKTFPPIGVLVVMLLFLIAPPFVIQGKTDIPRDYIGFIALAGGVLLAITIEYCRLYFSLTGSSSTGTPKLREFDSCNLFGFVAFMYLIIFASMYAKPNPNSSSAWICVVCTIVLYLLYRHVYKIYKAIFAK